MSSVLLRDEKTERNGDEGVRTKIVDKFSQKKINHHRVGTKVVRRRMKYVTGFIALGRFAAMAWRLTAGSVSGKVTRNLMKREPNWKGRV